jgi:hypothetical protein
MMLKSVWRPEGMARRLDGWNSGQMGVRTADRDSETADRDFENFCLESSAESSGMLLNSEIPV